MVDIRALVLQHDEQAVLCAVELALEDQQQERMVRGREAPEQVTILEAGERVSAQRESLFTGQIVFDDRVS